MIPIVSSDFSLWQSSRLESQLPPLKRKKRNEMNTELIPFITMSKTLPQYQCGVVQKLVYHRMIDGSIRHGCNGRDFVPSILG